VKGEFKNLANKKMPIRQGYLSSVPDRTVRVRVKGESGFITVKGKSNASGVSRFEWEKEIPLHEAEELLKICEPGIIEKTRYLVKSGEHTFEVDEFYGDNKGLIIAELELKSEDEAFFKPEWIGEEVTGDKKYYNAYLVKHPYKTW
ncbi:MAG: CYTH domain-containing protein, partial [Bacteroidales bacterium]|nr:CYTH domain-containing protein [Bacteroidales bacterium]